MLSRTGEYALRAVVYLAQNEDSWPIPGPQIARETKISPKYLSSILGTLVRSGVLEASPGRGGGFRMTRQPGKVLLVEILTPFESVLDDRRPCPFGNPVCSDDDPCAGHHRWKTVREAYYDFVQYTTVQEVSFSSSPRPAKRKKKRARRR